MRAHESVAHFNRLQGLTAMPRGGLTALPMGRALPARICALSGRGTLGWPIFARGLLTGAKLQFRRGGGSTHGVLGHGK